MLLPLTLFCSSRTLKFMQWSIYVGRQQTLLRALKYEWRFGRGQLAFAQCIIVPAHRASIYQRHEVLAQGNWLVSDMSSARHVRGWAFNKAWSWRHGMATESTYLYLNPLRSERSYLKSVPLTTMDTHLVSQMLSSCKSYRKMCSVHIVGWDWANLDIEGD